jgi:cytidine deaminase
MERKYQQARNDNRIYFARNAIARSWAVSNCACRVAIVQIWGQSTETSTSFVVADGTPHVDLGFACIGVSDL